MTGPNSSVADNLRAHAATPADADDAEPLTLPQVVSPDVAVFTVSVAARLAGMHPQTLRTYDRLGLVVPQRTRGAGRRYSPRDVRQLRLIQRLSQDEGINLEGIRRIIDLNNRLEAALARVDQLTALAQQLVANDGHLARVFTGETDGKVWPGRSRPPRQLTPARTA